MSSPLPSSSFPSSFPSPLSPSSSPLSDSTPIEIRDDEGEREMEYLQEYERRRGSKEVVSPNSPLPPSLPIQTQAARRGAVKVKRKQRGEVQNEVEVEEKEDDKIMTNSRMLRASLSSLLSRCILWLRDDGDQDPPSSASSQDQDSLNSPAEEDVTGKRKSWMVRPVKLLLLFTSFGLLYFLLTASLQTPSQPAQQLGGVNSLFKRPTQGKGQWQPQAGGTVIDTPTPPPLSSLSSLSSHVVSKRYKEYTSPLFSLVSIWRDMGPFESEVETVNMELWKRQRDAINLQLLALQSWLQLIPASRILVLVPSGSTCNWIHSHVGLKAWIGQYITSLSPSSPITGGALSSLNCRVIPRSDIAEFAMPMVKQIMREAEDALMGGGKEKENTMIGFICGTCLLDSEIIPIISHLSSELHAGRLDTIGKPRRGLFLSSRAERVTLASGLLSLLPSSLPSLRDTLSSLSSLPSSLSSSQRRRDLLQKIHAHPLKVLSEGGRELKVVQEELDPLLITRRMISTQSGLSFPPAVRTVEVKRKSAFAPSATTHPQWTLTPRRLLGSGSGFGLSSSLGLDFFLYSPSLLPSSSFPPFIAAARRWDEFLLALIHTGDAVRVDATEMGIVRALRTELEEVEDRGEEVRIREERRVEIKREEEEGREKLTGNQTPLQPLLPSIDIDERYGLGSKYNEELFHRLQTGVSAILPGMFATAAGEKGEEEKEAESVFSFGKYSSVDFHLLGTGCPKDCVLLFNSFLSPSHLAWKRAGRGDVQEEVERRRGQEEERRRKEKERWSVLTSPPSLPPPPPLPEHPAQLSLIAITAEQIPLLKNWVCWMERIVEERVGRGGGGGGSSSHSHSSFPHTSHSPPNPRNFLFLAFDTESYLHVQAMRLHAVMVPDAPPKCLGCLSRPPAPHLLFLLSLLIRFLLLDYTLLYCTAEQLWLNDPWMGIEGRDLEVKWGGREEGRRRDEAPMPFNPHAPTNSSLPATPTPSVLPSVMFLRPNERTLAFLRALHHCESSLLLLLPHSPSSPPSCFRSITWNTRREIVLQDGTAVPIDPPHQTWKMETAKVLMMTPSELLNRDETSIESDDDEAASGELSFVEVRRGEFTSLHQFAIKHTSQVRGVFPTMLDLSDALRSRTDVQVQALLKQWKLLAWNEEGEDEGGPTSMNPLAQTCSILPSPGFPQPLLLSSLPSNPFDLTIRILLSIEEYNVESLEMLLSSLKMAVYPSVPTSSPSPSSSSSSLISLQVRIDVVPKSLALRKALGEELTKEEAGKVEGEDEGKLADLKSAYISSQLALQQVLLYLNKFTWPHGAFTVLVEKVHVGRTGLWTTKWEPASAAASSKATPATSSLPHSFLLLLPSDVLLSPHYYSVSKTVVERYYTDTLEKVGMQRVIKSNRDGDASPHSLRHVPHFPSHLMGISLVDWRELDRNQIEREEGEERVRGIMEREEGEESFDLPHTEGLHINTHLLFRSAAIGKQGLLLFHHTHEAFVQWMKEKGFDRKTGVAKKVLACVPFCRTNIEWLSNPKEVWQAYMMRFMQENDAYFLHLNLGAGAALVESFNPASSSSSSSSSPSLLTRAWSSSTKLPHTLEDTPILDRHLHPMAGAGLGRYWREVQERVNVSKGKTSAYV
jgi:hypothetical protein